MADYLYQKIDKLMFIDKYPLYGGSGWMYIAKCDCGGRCKLSDQAIKYRIKMGKKLNCGCEKEHDRNFKDLTGKRFGMLKVIKEAPPVRLQNKDGKWYNQIQWYCKCDCGKTTIKPSTYLTSSINPKRHYVANCGCNSKKHYERDLSGKEVNGIKIIDKAYTKINKNGSFSHYWNCICPICGKKCIIPQHSLVRGKVQSCGCLQVIKTKKHGLWNHRLYGILSNMKQRCYNTKDNSYDNYGRRGIYVCDEWLDKDNGFMNFYNWSYANGFYDQPKGTKKKDLLQIDRIDNDGPYAPWNCRWTSARNNMNNRSCNVYIRDYDKMVTYGEFGYRYGYSNHHVAHRLNRGWSVDAIVYAAHNQELGIHRHMVNYVDKDGFIVLIPTLEKQIEKYNKEHNN